MITENGLHYNRLIWMRPDGSFESYDKRHLFRYANEQDHYTAGNSKLVLELKGWKICPLVCYDLRFPAWIRNRYQADGEATYDLLLFVANWPARRSHPWKTLLMARAMENQCFVAVAPTVGLAPWSAALDVNHGQATIFGPVDRGFPADGVLAAGAMDAPGWVIADLDPASLDTVRRDGAVRNHLAWPAVPPACPVERPQ